jgi:hypothetical protein
MLKAVSSPVGFQQLIEKCEHNQPDQPLKEVELNQRKSIHKLADAFPEFDEQLFNYWMNSRIQEPDICLARSNKWL